MRRGLFLAAMVVAAGLFAVPHASAAGAKAAGTCPSGNLAILSPTLTVVQGGTATATFKIARYCSNIQVNLASYDAPQFDFALPQTLIDFAPKPLNGPTRYSYNNGVTYTLTTNVSSCFFQVDLVRGAVIENLTTSLLYGDRKLKWQNGGTKCVTKITTTAQPTTGVAIGGAISDSAVLSGLSAGGGGTLTFKVYGPDDATCATAAKFTSTVNVSGSNTYPSGNYTPTAPGTYRWTASYSGDSKNAAVSSACNAQYESVVVSKKTPTFSTVASANGPVGTYVTDTATLGGTYNATGTITFSLWSNTTCAGSPVFTTTKSVTGNGSYTSASYKAVAAGSYRWVASYGGDANNAPKAGACGDANESVTISQAGPSLSTVASGAVLINNPISDTATLTGGVGATGTITFKLYGPNNLTCTGAAAFTTTKSVAGNGSYTSATFTPTVAGEYRWVADYSGDLNNAAAHTSCGDAGESVTVGEDHTKPLCVLSQTVIGPPKQLKITVQDAESGISSITVDAATANASVSGNTGFPSGTTAAITVTATKINQAQGSFVRLKVTNNAGLVTVCDPYVPASKPARSAAAAARVKAAASFTFKADTRRATFGSDQGVVLSGTVPGAAGQTVVLQSQACGFKGASDLVKVKTGPGGAFRYRMLPGLTATYSVRWNGVTKSALVSVRPQIALSRESAGRFRIDVSTTNGMFLDGTEAQLQRFSGGKWTAIRTVTLAQSSPEDAMIAVSSGTFAASVFGKLRAVLPATSCYAGGTSAPVSG